MKVLQLIDSLDYRGSARQLRLLGPAFARCGLPVEICCIGPTTPWLTQLRTEGVLVHVLNWTRWFDPTVIWNLRAILRQAQPDLIHVWRISALRTLAVAAPRLLPRALVTIPAPSHCKLSMWDRWLLGQARCLAVNGASDLQFYQHQGLHQLSLNVIPPAVDVDKASPDELPIPAGHPSILCAGPLEHDTGMREAIWALDFLMFQFPHARLRIVGAGSQAQALRSLSAGLQTASQVEFLEPRADLTSLLNESTVVWAPSMANCGRQFALDAMAQARAVVGFAVPCLQDTIGDSETGFLVRRGDVVALARLTTRLFLDAELRARIGQAAKKSVRDGFRVDDVAERWCELYQSAAA